MGRRAVPRRHKPVAPATIATYALMSSQHLINHPTVKAIQVLLDKVSKMENKEMAVAVALMAAARYDKSAFYLPASCVKTENVLNFLFVLKKQLVITNPALVAQHPALSAPSRQTAQSGLAFMQQNNLLPMYLAWIITTSGGGGDATSVDATVRARALIYTYDLLPVPDRPNLPVPPSLSSPLRRLVFASL